VWNERNDECKNDERGTMTKLVQASTHIFVVPPHNPRLSIPQNPLNNNTDPISRQAISKKVSGFS
jgi:hypothetical protein